MKERFWNVPNTVTLSRLVFVGLFVYYAFEGEDVLAVVAVGVGVSASGGVTNSTTVISTVALEMFWPSLAL